MATLKEDIVTSAEWVSTALQSSGYRADFSTQSTEELERFFNEQSKDGKPIEGSLLSEELGSRLFSLGSYLGEVLRRNIGGEWIVDDNDPQGEMNIALKLSTGALCWPVQKIIKRFKNGSEENIAHYAQTLGLSAKGS